MQKSVNDRVPPPQPVKARLRAYWWKALLFLMLVVLGGMTMFSQLGVMMDR